MGNHEVMDRSEILDVLKEKLSLESRWLLVTLAKEARELYKEELRDITNAKHKEINNEILIVSRHSLDIHTARLEGAALVDVRELGRIRLYSVSKLGKALLAHGKNN